MAIFYAVLKSGCGPTGVYTAYCESKDDLAPPAAETWGEGSTVFCLNTDAGRVISVHVKLPNGSWNEVANSGGSGMTEEFKQALLDAFDHVQWDDDKGPERIQRLYDALYPLTHITADYTQSGEVYETDGLDYLRSDLVVTAFYQGGGSETITDYDLSGTLVEGTSTITVSYGGKTATFDVVVSEAPLLPREYQQVEWISANNGTTEPLAHIDTGFIPTPSSSIYARFAAIGTQSGRNFIGSRDASTGANKALLIISFASAGKIGFMRWGASVQCINYDNDFHDYELTPTTAKIDGNSYSMTAPVTSQSSTIPFKLFLNWSGGDWQNANNMKISYIKLAEGDTTVHEYISCYRKADNEIGMYDLVTNTFKKNDGTGAFTKGGDVL